MYKVKSVHFMNPVIVGGKAYNSFVAGDWLHNTFVELFWKPELPFLIITSRDRIREIKPTVICASFMNVLRMEFEDDVIDSWLQPEAKALRNKKQ